MTGSSTKKQNPFVTGSSTKKKNVRDREIGQKKPPVREALGRAEESWGESWWELGLRPKEKKNVCDGEFGQKNPSVRGPAKKKNVRAAKKKRITLSPYNDLLIISIK